MYLFDLSRKLTVILATVVMGCFLASCSPGVSKEKAEETALKTINAFFTGDIPVAMKMGIKGDGEMYTVDGNRIAITPDTELSEVSKVAQAHANENGGFDKVELTNTVLEGDLYVVSFKIHYKNGEGTEGKIRILADK